MVHGMAVLPKTPARASVHAIVEGALLCGDLVPGATAQRLLDGVRGHQSLQSVPDPDARNEAPVSFTVEGERIVLTVYGRIDRLYGLSVVEEIKTTLDAAPEDALPLHWAQAECYAFMLCEKEGLSHIDVRITYLNLSSGEVTRFTRSLTHAVLAERFYGYVRPYLAHLDELAAHRAEVALQMKALAFPFAQYRAGQRELAAEIFRTIRDKKMLLAQAPTGTGKTLAALFPALKGIGEGFVERIFYLTARTTARRAAFDALGLLPDSALRAIALYAREKVCIHDAPLCRTGTCPRQIGYYDRLPQALAAAKALPGRFDREAVRALADEYELCPFEFSLDLSLECDVIVCDYNYLFDPRVRLQRYASGSKQGQVLLIDEAHNLPDRAREMYSARLPGKLIDRARRSIPQSARKGELYLSLRALRRTMEAAAEEGEIPRAEETPRPELTERCEAVLCALQESAEGDPALCAQLRLELTGWVYQSAGYDETCRLLFEGGKSSREITLYCTDASARTGAVLRRSRAAILFSATLTPPEFYKTLCGMKEDSACVHLLSPFPPENLLVLHLPVSTRYKAREATLPRVVSAVAALALSREKGNFITFFPSYAYLRQAAELLEPLLDGKAELLIQTPEMDEEARAAFLSRFSPEPDGRLLALCAMGGVFSEGIDLPADRLCGAAVVGVGLPQIGVERDALRKRYDEAYGDGYAYAYVYPGVGKVLQAAGRVIRSENDRGALLLIDDRYAADPYPALLPAQWTLRRVFTDKQIAEQLRGFWNQN